MRKNLDPFYNYKDEVLWKTLEDVELRDSVAERPASINSRMSEGGTNFRQNQLVRLDMAINRSNKVLVLDEATANVDPHTDGLIQTTIRQKYADCTVLTIAHRLHTSVDSDKALVMDAGRMVEFDHPYVSMQNKEGVMYGMVEQMGKGMKDVLSKESKVDLDETLTNADSHTALYIQHYFNNRSTSTHNEPFVIEAGTNFNRLNILTQNIGVMFECELSEGAKEKQIFKNGPTDVLF